MRTDMHKVIVERPRHGSHDKADNKGYKTQLERENPLKEGMKKRSGGTKELNEHLAPLVRYLRTNCGRPWDKIYSEIRQNLKLNSACQYHVYQHLFDYVKLHCYKENGQIYGPDGTPVGKSFFFFNEFAVVGGILTDISNLKKRKWTKPAKRLWKDENSFYHQINGVWYLIGVEKLVKRFTKLGFPIREMDILTGSSLKTFSSTHIAKTKKQLGKRELKEFRKLFPNS